MNWDQLIDRFNDIAVVVMGFALGLIALSMGIGALAIVISILNGKM